MTSEIKPEDVKLPEPAFWYKAQTGGIRSVRPSGWNWAGQSTEPEGYALLFTADQVRAAVLEAKAQERERCARLCEELRDLREEARAILQASKSLKEGDAEETLRRLRHESDVRLHNGALDRAAAAIRSGHSITETKRD